MDSRHVKVLALFLLVIALAAGAVTTRNSYNFDDRSDHITKYVETVPTLIPAVAEDIWTSSVWIEEITLTNKTAVAQTVTIKDKQAVAREVLSAVQVDANSTYVIRFTARYCPSGVSWVASDAASIVGYVRAKK